MCYTQHTNTHILAFNTQRKQQCLRQVVSWRPTGAESGVEVKTAGGDTYHAQQLVISAGSWVPKFLPELKVGCVLCFVFEVKLCDKHNCVEPSGKLDPLPWRSASAHICPDTANAVSPFLFQVLSPLTILPCLLLLCVSCR